MSHPNQETDSSRIGPSVLRLLSGSLGGQCILLLSAPLLSRLYSPAEFGMFGVFFALVATGSTFGTLRYDMALVSADQRAVVYRLFWGVIALAAGSSVLLVALLFGIPAIITSLFPNNEIHNLCWLLPIALFVHICMLTITRLASKHDAFGQLGMAVVLGRVCDLSVKIGLASVLGWQGLVLGMIAGDLVSMSITALATPKLLAMPDFELRSYLQAFREYRQFPLYNLPSAFGGSLAKGFPVIGLTMLFNPIVAGCYEMASRTLGRPSALLGNQFYTVFYPKSVKQLAQTGSIANMVETWLPRLMLLLFVPFLLVGLLGEPLFAFVFGPEWALAGSYAAILAPAWYLSSVAIPIRVFNTLSKQRLAMVWQAMFLLVTTVAIGFGFATGNEVATVWLISAVWSIAYLLHLSLTLRLSGAEPRRILARLFTPVLTLTGRKCQRTQSERDPRMVEAATTAPLRRAG